MNASDFISALSPLAPWVIVLAVWIGARRDRDQLADKVNDLAERVSRIEGQLLTFHDRLMVELAERRADADTAERTCCDLCCGGKHDEAEAPDTT